tara:strand:+ start:460 stop:645 length:186 start_codon:yes stop_codon:yes gene_type:complete
MKVAIKFTADINMDTVKEYMEDLQETDQTPREFALDCIREWGLQGFDSATQSAIGMSIYLN